MEEKTPVAKALIRKNSKFLMLKKSQDYDFTGHRWEQPGGKIEDGEDRFKALKREIKEETGLQIGKLEDLVRIEIEAEECINCYVIHVGEFSGDIELSDEHEDYRWVSAEEFGKMNHHRDSAYILPAMRYCDNYLLKQRDYGSYKDISVVKALIRNNEGDFLAVRKSVIEKVSSGQRFKKYGDMSGKWELPGGRIGANDEDRFDAAERELREELGIEIEKGVDIVREEIEEENTVDVYIVLYEPENWSGEVTLSDEHSELKWVSPKEYLDLDWHKDAGYGFSPMKYLEDYLELEKNY